jgi:multicomponent K+:H+ antiporter subunit D
MNTTESLAALLYYLVHSTWICAVLFLLADVLRQQRGTVADLIARGPPLLQGTSLGILFFIAAASVVGMPPTSGFVGKVSLMQAAASPQQVIWVWPALLLAGLLTITALSRSGSTFFWRTDGEVTGEGRASAGALAAIGGLLAVSLALSFAGSWVLPFMEATAAQLADPAAYRQAADAYQPIRGNSP